MSTTVDGDREQQTPRRPLLGLVPALLAVPLSWGLWVWPFQEAEGWIREWGYAGFFITLAALAVVAGFWGARNNPVLLGAFVFVGLGSLIPGYVDKRREEKV